MFYVYCRHLASGREDFVNCYETSNEAIEKITLLYNLDRNSCMKGQYYYFMKERCK